MLATLSIKNIVLIDQLTIDFSKGLCALTGETGAGKSILLDSLGLALGARADAGLVRHGCAQASVIADFDLSLDHHVFNILKENDISNEGELIVRRSLTAEGRSKAFINDQPISVNLLKKIAENLIEIHGQFDTHALLNPQNHITLLDEYGGHEKDLTKIKTIWATWKDLTATLQRQKEAIDNAREDEEYFRKSLEDIDALSPKDKEEDKLSKLRERLMRREHILESLNEARQGVEDIENMSGNVWRALEKIGEDGQEAINAMDRTNAELQEVLESLAKISSDIENSEYSLSEIDDRLFALKAQARKHDCDIDALSQKRDEIAQALFDIENQDHDFAQLIKQCEQAENEFQNLADKLSEKRQKAAKKMAKDVMDELAPLKLEKTRFEVAVYDLDKENWTQNGSDKVEFLIATNPGAVAGPLNKVASGGELSRFTLALKVVLSETGMAQSLVFDEVDSGIGGATAAAVGERLSKLSQHKQILVVTHSPQVAAIARHHWIVSKTGTKDVKTNIIPLQDNKDRQEEIARMLAGASISDEARAAAGKLLEGHSKKERAA